MMTAAINLSPPPNQAEMQDNNIQLMIQRKAELAKNKAKHTLTERDGTLLVTHSTELIFADAQVIVEEGHELSNVYRIKSGKVNIIRNGHKCCQLSQGYFIGDSLLLYDDRSSYRMSIALVAEGPVVLLQLDLSFVKTLFNLDIPLAMKFFHLVATKSASIFHQLVVSLDAPALISSSLDAHDTSSSASDTASDTSESNLSSGLSHSTSFSSTSINAINAANAAENAASSTINLCTTPPATTPKRKPHIPHRFARAAPDAYKVFQLSGSRHGVQTCRIKPTKIKIVTRSFGFQHKVSVEFARLNTITKIAENGVTIVHSGKKFQTIFFKTRSDTEEFMYLVASLNTPNEQTEPIVLNQPISTPPAQEDVETEDGQLTKGEEAFQNIQSQVVLKKGDKVFEEGDLFQRVYTLVTGTLAVYQNGVLLHELTDGQIFGVDTILFLRPAPVTIEVVSETATLLVIPAYKMHELIDSDILVALNIYKRAAQILDSQIAKIWQVELQLQGTPSRKSGEFGRSGEYRKSGEFGKSRQSGEIARKSGELPVTSPVPIAVGSVGV